MIKSSVIAAVIGLGLYLAIALWPSSSEVYTLNEGPVVTGDCYSEGPGPAEPALCT